MHDEMVGGDHPWRQKEKQKLEKDMDYFTINQS